MNKTLSDEAMRDAERPRTIQSIAEAVAKLTVPPLVPLYQTFLKMEGDLRKQRGQLSREHDDVREEGFEAATRLALSLAEVSARHIGYFEHLTRKDQP